MKKGTRNLITDVPGVKVGHQTIHQGDSYTGVTAILPHPGNLFREKLPAAVQVINGFGKSVGTIQVEELGTLETPILLTNTFGVGTAATALVRSMLAENAEIGDTTGTVNPLVFECNDGSINNIRNLAVTEADCQAALTAARFEGEVFAEGAVGAGSGMCCYDLKGGIGSASRIIELSGKDYTLGCLVLSNFGQLKNLMIYGYPLGLELSELFEVEAETSASQPEKKEQGSIIVILATDLPLSSRQLKRIAKRASVGISRTGAFIGNGSGEIALVFSTAQKVEHFDKAATRNFEVLNENYLDEVFEATAEVVEESVISSLFHGRNTVNRRGKIVPGLLQAMNRLQMADYAEARRFLMEKIADEVRKTGDFRK